MINTDITIEIDSKRCNKTFEVKRFTEFNVDIDLETDSDSFDLVTKNPRGIYTALFSKFDACRLKLNNKVILTGNLDNVSYMCTETDNYIKITGRDLCWKLVDNDALPDNLENIVPKNYVSNKCNEYGIKHSLSDTDVYPKLVIGCNESEISIINNILLEGKHRKWFLIDTLYTGDWATNISPTVVLSNPNSNVHGIPIKTIEVIEDGTDMMSDIVLYGTDDSGIQKITGSATNKLMNLLGIIKRRIRRQYSDSASSKYTSIANRDIRDSFRDNIIVRATVRIDNNTVFMPNTTVRVVYDRLGIDSILFIKAVNYSKSIDSGSSATLTMIPADSTFESMWQSTTNMSITNFTQESLRLAR